MKTKILQLIGGATACLLAVSCTTAPYYSGAQGYPEYSDKGYSSAPYQAPAQSGLNSNALPLIATGVAALALYGYAKERSNRKDHKRKYHSSYYGHDYGHGGYPSYPNRYRRH